MTTTEAAAEELLTAFMGKEDEDERAVEHPLLLAALMKRRQGRGETLMENPVLAEALLGRR
jgi:hypothetical protein